MRAAVGQLIDKACFLLPSKLRDTIHTRVCLCDLSGHAVDTCIRRFDLPSNAADAAKHICCHFITAYS